MTENTTNIKIQNIAIPPQQVKDIIDKTVGYVLKNGKSFEERLKSSNDSGKFSFLNDNDQFNAYYLWKLSGGVSDKTTSISTGADNANTSIIIPKPRELPFLIESPPISALDRDIIKLAALFVARNKSSDDKKKDYAKALLQHETKKGNKHQFEFLNPSHSFHGLFLKLVHQYELVISLMGNTTSATNDTILQTLQKPNDLFERAFNRAQYNKQHKSKLKDEQKSKRDKQLHYASIDWQDFKLVGKLGFTAVDEVIELPAPLSRNDLIYRSLQAKNEELKLRVEKAPPAANKPDTEIEEQNRKSVTPKPKGMKIKAAGESRLKNRKLASSASPASASGSDKMIKCPLTGKLVAEDQFDNHLKVLLRDPRYQEQQNNFIKKNFLYDSNLTTDQVYENVKRLARKRGLGDDDEGAAASKKQA